MKPIVILALLLSLSSTVVFGQVKIGDNPQNINAASVLELESNNQVLVITRVNNQAMESITPLRGGVVYNTDTQCLHYYNGTEWINLCDAVSFSLTNDPIENITTTISIVDNGGTINLEVAPNSIRSENIVDGGINGDDIQDNSIGESKLGADAVGANELRDNSVGTIEIIDGSITPADMSNSGPNQVLTTDATGLVNWVDASNVSGVVTNVTTITGTGIAGDELTISDAVQNAISINSQDIAEHIGTDMDTDDRNELTDLSYDAATNTLSLTRSDVGTTVNLDALNNAGTDNQNLNLTATNVLEIERGNTVDLNSFLDNTDAQELEINGNIISISGGNDITLPAGAVDTDEQNLTLVGTTLNITNGLGVDLSPVLGDANTDSQNLELTGNTLNISGGTGVDLTPILGGANTDEQNLSLAGTALNITNGAGVDLAPILGATNTDEQNLSLTDNTLNITNGIGVDLTPILGGVNTDEQNAAQVPFTPYGTLLGPSTQLAIEQLKDELDAATIAGGGENPNNELQDIQLAGTILSLTIPATAGNQIDLDPTFVSEIEFANANFDDADADANNEIQNLTIIGDDLSISGGNTITLPIPAGDWTTLANIPPGFADNVDDDTNLDEAAVDAFVANNGFLTAEIDDSITNEIQTLAIAGNDLTLSNGGGTVTIPAAGAADWTTLTGIPAGFADNVDDDTNLDEAAVDAFVANNGFLTAEIDDSITNEIQTLAIAGNDLTLSNGGGTVTIPAAGAADWTTLTGVPAGFADNVDDDTNLDEAAVDAFVANNGFLTAEIDDSITNEIQTLAIAGNDLTLSNGGGTVTIPAAGAADWTTLTGVPAGFADNVDDDTNLDEAAVDAFVANNGFLTAEIDDSITNEIQTLAIAGNDLTLSNGGGTVTIPAAGAADWTTLTGVPAGFADNVDDDTNLDEAAVDAFVANNGFLTAEIDDSITNEIQTLAIAGNDLTLSNGGGTVTIPAAGAADWTTLTGVPAGFADNVDDDTNLDEAAVDAFVANNGFLTAEIDDSITNEIQTLAIAGNDLTLSNGGGTVTIPAAGAADWTTLTGIPAGFADNVDDDTQYTPGIGLTLNGSAFDVNNLAGQVTGPISATIISDGSITGGLGGQIVDNSITASDLAPDSVNASEIRIDAVGQSEIETGGVATAEIENLTIVNEDISGTAAIDGFKINPNFGAQNIITTGGLSVGGDILLNGNAIVPDYVFQKYFTGTSTLNATYKFQSLQDIEDFVKRNQHLPGVQSAAEIKKQGYWNLGKASRINLEKIEELFLHTIEQEKKIKELKNSNANMAKEVEQLKAQMEEIKKMVLARHKN